MPSHYKIKEVTSFFPTYLEIINILYYPN